MGSSLEFDQFVKDLDKIIGLVDLVGAIREFAGGSAIVDGGEYDSASEIESLRSLSVEMHASLSILVGSLCLYACGRFENFVRELVREAAGRQLDQVGSFADMPKSIKDSLRERVLMVLRESGKYSYLGISESQLVSTLSNLIEADPSVRISNVPTAVLATTEANMRPAILSEVFGRVGLNRVWDDVSKQARLRTHFGSTSERDCSKAAKEFLEELMTYRNSVAHPRGAVTFKGIEQTREMLKTLRELSSAIDDVAHLPVKIDS